MPGADPSWVLDPYVESANSRAYIDEGLERGIHATQAAGAAGMLAYAAILFGTPFIIEAGVVAWGFGQGAGLSLSGVSTTAWLTGQHLGTGVATYVGGSALARGALTVGGIVEEADSVASGEPLGLPDIPSIPRLRSRSRFRSVGAMAADLPAPRVRTWTPSQSLSPETVRSMTQVPRSPVKRVNGAIPLGPGPSYKALPPARHGDFHGPWRPDPGPEGPPGYSSWGHYLEASGAGPIPRGSMPSPHAHHSVQRHGRGRQVPLLERAHDLLRRRGGINAHFDLNNLAWNSLGGGNHSTQVARDQLLRLEALDASNGTPQQFRDLLRSFTAEATARTRAIR